MAWEKAVSVQELNKKQRKIFKKGSKQIVLFQTVHGFYALDNRCPHEGYPLIQGAVEGRALTCHWHNWKFDLQTGACLLGEDPVQTYPIKEEDGMLWVDLSPPSPEEIASRLLNGLETAFEKRQTGRIARELARLHFHQIDPLLAVTQAIEWSYEKLEFGMTHAYAACADWLTLYHAHEGDLEKQLVCLTETVDHITFDASFRPHYPFSKSHTAFSEDSFICAIEAGKEAIAIPMLLGALEAGWHFKDLEKTLSMAALKHYNDFGHSLIYVYKTGELIDHLGPAVERPLLLALTRSLCYATQEDRIPEFQDYAKFLKECGTAPNPAAEPLKGESVFQKSTQKALSWVAQQTHHFAPESIYAALLEANAKNLLHFDMQRQYGVAQQVSENVGWLDFTHGLTFANAVRAQCKKFPELWNAGLLQMACFSGRNQGFLKENLEEAAWQVTHPEQFWAEGAEQLLDHGLPLPIHSCHQLKTYCAAKAEAAAFGGEVAKTLLAALNRFLHSPIKQKHTRRLVHQGIDLVSKDF